MIQRSVPGNNEEQSPAMRLLKALDGICDVCSNAHLFVDLAEQHVREGTPPYERLSDLLCKGCDLCDDALEALRAGAGAGVDAAQNPGEKRWSDKLKGRLEAAQDWIFFRLGLALGTPDHMRNDKARGMEELGGEVYTAMCELRNAIRRGDQEPARLIRASDVEKKYVATSSTIARHIEEGDLIDYRPAGSSKRGVSRLLDEAQVEKLFARREVARAARSKVAQK